MRHRDSGRAYIGATHYLDGRLQGHVAASKKPKTPIAEAVGRFGIEAFDISVIATFDGWWPSRAAGERERAEMRIRGTFWPAGFNLVGLPHHEMISRAEQWRSLQQAVGANETDKEQVHG